MAETPGPEEILLKFASRDDLSTTIECLTGKDLIGHTQDWIYTIEHKPFGSPTFSVIYTYTGGLPQDAPFIVRDSWQYKHAHGSFDSAQYKVIIQNTLTFISYTSNTITASRFAGFAKKTTRYSDKSFLKRQAKTRNQTPRF